MGRSSADVDPRASFLVAWTLDVPALAGRAAPPPRHPTPPQQPTPPPRQPAPPPRQPAPPPPARQLRLLARPPKRVRVADTPPAVASEPWPTSTTLWCWHCCHPFGGQPLPLPVRYDDRRDVFHVAGTFCSWSCMKAYNWESASYMKPVIINNITLFHKRCTGVLRGIRTAPPRQALRVFGGHMSIEEFRAAADLPTDYTLVPRNVIPHDRAIEERVTQRAVNEAAKARDRPPPDLKAEVDFQNVSTKNETLRLKRPKPLHTSRNLLERTMGLCNVNR